MALHDPHPAPVTTDSDVKAIQQLTERWIAAVNAQEIEPLLGLVTDDVIFLPPSGPPIQGKEAVGDLYRSIFTQFEFEQSIPGVLRHLATLVPAEGAGARPFGAVAG